MYDPGMLANYVWAQYESGDIDDREISEDIRSNTSLQELLRESLPNEIWEQLIPTWKSAVDELRSSVDKLVVCNFDSELAQAAAEKARAFCSSVEEEVYKLEIQEAEVADCKKFWQELIAVLTEAKKNLHQDNEVLNDIATIESLKTEDINSLPDDRWKKLENIRLSLHEYMSEEKSYDRLAERSGSVPAEERREIHTKLGRCIEAQEKCKLTIKDGIEAFASIAAEMVSRSKNCSNDSTPESFEESGDIAKLGESPQGITSNVNHVHESEKEFEVYQEGNLQDKEIELSSENRILQANFESLREENISLSLEVSHLKKNLKSYWLESNLNKQQEANPNGKKHDVEDKYRSVFDILRKNKNQFQNILFLDSAIDSAMSCPYKDTSKIGKLISDLNEFVPQWKESKCNSDLGIDPAVYLKNRGWGKRNSSHISDTAKGKYGDEYTFTYKGNKVLFGSHITVGKRNANTCLSLHYIFDQDEEKIVIAHLGRHLPNTRT